MAITHVNVTNNQLPIERAIANPVPQAIKVLFLKGVWPKALIQSMPSREYKLLLEDLKPSLMEIDGGAKAEAKAVIRQLRKDRQQHMRTFCVPVITKCGYVEGKKARLPEHALMDRNYRTEDGQQLNLVFIKGFWWTEQAYAENQAMHKKLPTKQEVTAIIRALKKADFFPWKSRTGYCLILKEFASHFVQAMGVDRKYLATVKCEVPKGIQSDWPFHAALIITDKDSFEVHNDDFVCDPIVARKAVYINNWLRLWSDVRFEDGGIEVRDLVPYLPQVTAQVGFKLSLDRSRLERFYVANYLASL